MRNRVGRPPKIDVPLRVDTRPDMKAALDEAAKEAGVPTGRLAEILLASFGVSKAAYLRAYAETISNRADTA